MAWIKTIGFEEARGRLRTIYDQIAGRRKAIDNILTVHSLRPHTLSGHLALYKSVLHHTGNELSTRLLESVGVLVSRINGCSYCEEHHAAGLRRSLDDEGRADALLSALHSGRFEDAFGPAESAALRYAAKLTGDPSSVRPDDLKEMRSEGMSDGQILEVNQVAAYFAYANRTVSGLGVSLEGDQLGLSPGKSNDITDWEHR